MKDRWSSNRV